MTLTYDITYMTDKGELTHRRAQEAETLKDALEQARRFWPCAAVAATIYVGKQISGIPMGTVYKDSVTLSMLQERISHE